MHQKREKTTKTLYCKNHLEYMIYDTLGYTYAFMLPSQLLSHWPYRLYSVHSAYPATIHTRPSTSSLEALLGPRSEAHHQEHECEVAQKTRKKCDQRERERERKNWHQQTRHIHEGLLCYSVNVIYLVRIGRIWIPSHFQMPRWMHQL